MPWRIFGSFLYLLNPEELEDERKRVTDCNWSPQIYHIKESLVQKNQPVLYWLMDENGDGPERSFVQEELMVVRNIEYLLREYSNEVRMFSV